MTELGDAAAAETLSSEITVLKYVYFSGSLSLDPKHRTREAD